MLWKKVIHVHPSFQLKSNIKLIILANSETLYNTKIRHASQSTKQYLKLC